MRARVSRGCLRLLSSPTAKSSGSLKETARNLEKYPFEPIATEPSNIMNFLDRWT